MMWAFVSLAVAELIVVHFLVALWRPWIAVVLSLLSLVVILWLVSVIVSFRRLPVLIDGERLVMRVGTLRSIEVPIGAVTGVRNDWSAEALKASGVVNLALLAYPNILVDLEASAVRRRRRIIAVAHRLDDPAGFTRALAAVVSARAA
jgi:hypothetical protein